MAITSIVIATNKGCYSDLQSTFFARWPDAVAGWPGVPRCNVLIAIKNIMWMGEKIIIVIFAYDVNIDYLI